MPIICLIPGVLCLYMIWRRGSSAALQYVVLPTMLLLPDFYYFVAKPLPAINFIDAAFMGLAPGIFLLDLRRWKFTTIDIWMAVFLFTTYYDNYVHNKTTNAAFSLFGSLTCGLVPYMAGKLLVEQMGWRISIGKAFVWLLSVSSFVSAIEFFFKTNPYSKFWAHFFPGQWTTWRTQIRWGFGRVAGPFSQSELAGMVVFTALLLALWLGRQTYDEAGARNPIAAPLEHGKRHIWILIVALYMTQARGPWLGGIFGITIAAIGRSRRPLRRAILTVGVIVFIAAPAYYFGKDYLAGPRVNSGSEKETAQYRAELIQNYVPVAIKGGAWGWGDDWPHMHGQDSIDNEYLLAWVMQGYVGAIAFLLIVGDSILRLTYKCFKMDTVRERHFATTMLGLVMGVAFTITTVFLGSQSYELFFFIIGWAQAVRQPRVMVKGIRNTEMLRLEGEEMMVRTY